MEPRPVATGIALFWFVLAIVGGVFVAWERLSFSDWALWQRLLAGLLPLFALGLLLLYCFRPNAFSTLHCALLPLLSLAAVVFAVVSGRLDLAVLFVPLCLLLVPFLVRELRKKPPPPHVDFFPGARTAGASQALRPPFP